MNSEYLIVAVVTGAISFVSTWGMLRRQVSELDKKLEAIEKETHRQLELIHSLRDVYVSQQHFNEIMQTIRETHRELKDDMKKILDLLTLRS